MSGVFAPLRLRLVSLEAQSSSDSGRQDHTQDYAADDDHDFFLQKQTRWWVFLALVSEAAFFLPEYWKELHTSH